MARKVPFEDPEVLNYVRIGYVFSQVLALGLYYYISYKVRLYLLPPWDQAEFMSLVDQATE